jgi:transposase-like protein
MLNMSAKKSGAHPPREGTASAVREAARSGAEETAVSPGRPTRKKYTAEYKLRILREVDAAIESGEPGAVGELMRREGIYSSNLNTWRAQREAGELAGLTPKKRGRKPTKNPLSDELARLQRENARLQRELDKAQTIIDVQKKVAALLGETLAEPTEEDFRRAEERANERTRTRRP